MNSEHSNGFKEFEMIPDDLNIDQEVLIEDTHFDRRFFRKSCRLTQPNHQVERRRVQIEAEVVGQEAVITKPVGLQFTFQFHVAILAFTTLCILIIMSLAVLQSSREPL